LGEKRIHSPGLARMLEASDHGEEQEKKRARMIMIRKNLKGLGCDV